MNFFCRILLLSVTITSTYDIETINLKTNPGLLPFKLGNAKLKYSSHTFVHYFDITPINNELKVLAKQFDKISNTDDSILARKIQTMVNLLKVQFNRIDKKIESLYPQHRIKRSLFDGLGSALKFFTGNLDANDGKKYDQAISMLETNQNHIIKTLKQQISLSKTTMIEYENVIRRIKENVELVTSRINEMKYYHHNTDEKYMIMNNALNGINVATNIILQSLNDIENAIMFARVNLTHSSILSIKDLTVLIDQVVKLHSEKVLFFGINTNIIYKYYEIIETEVYLSNNKIVFLFHFPLISPELYSYYQLFPIPTTNNTIIIPKSPYLLLSQDNYQYENSPCKNIHPVYYCTNNNVIKYHQDGDCTVEILQIQHNQLKNCKNVPITITESIIQQIDTSYFIAIFPNETKIRINCINNTKYNLLQGNYLIKVPVNCSFQTPTGLYMNNDNALNGEPFFLPKLNISNVTSQSIVLQDMSLDKIYELHQLQKNLQLETTNSVHNHRYIWITYTHTIIIISIILLIIIFLVYQRKGKNQQTTREPEIKSNMPNHTTHSFLIVDE